MNHRSASELTANSVFIDSGSLTPREAVGVIEAAQDRGADVYVASGLLGSLEGGRLMKTLFQTPVTRVRRKLASPPGYAFKRTLDVIGSSVALALLSPVIAVLVVVIKMTAPCPVFLTQTRLGLPGRTFGFLKSRSMYVNSGSSSHERYVRSLINGRARPTATGGNVNGVFRIVDDPRITPVGRIIRKYSRDEIPELVNVFRGEMSLAGSQPPLPYQVAA